MEEIFVFVGYCNKTICMEFIIFAWSKISIRLKYPWYLISLIIFHHYPVGMPWCYLIQIKFKTKIMKIWKDAWLNHIKLPAEW